MEAHGWVPLLVFLYLVIQCMRLQDQMLRIEAQIAMLEVTISTQ